MKNPAGWYPDPTGDGTTIRYWSGAVWTEYTQAIAESGVSGNMVSSTFVTGTPVQPPYTSSQPPAAPPQLVSASSQLTDAYAQPPIMPFQPIYAPGQNGPVFVRGSQGEGRQGFAIAGFVLGIVSIISVCLFYLTVIPGLLAIIFSALGIKSSQKGLAIAGLILGVTGILFGIGMTLLVIIAAQSATNPSVYF